MTPRSLPGVLPMHHAKRRLIPLVLLAAAVAARGGGAQTGPVTTVRVTDKVLVKDCIRLGINLGGDNYYSGAALVKKRVCENFEGTSYRQSI